MIDFYKKAGVDTDLAEKGLSKLSDHIKKSWNQKSSGNVLLPQGYFANILEFLTFGIAMSTDGVGTKTLIATRLGKFDTIGIDCVANNVNDILCVGATPISMTDYIAMPEADDKILEQIGIGLTKGALEANISISGGEIAQLKGVVNELDLVGTIIGKVDLDKIIVGQKIEEGNIIIGIHSSGIHSNGLTLAREAMHTSSLSRNFEELSCTLGEELLKPTFIYSKPILALLEHERESVTGLINITSDGLLNLSRVNLNRQKSYPVGFIIKKLPPVPPIFELIQTYGKIPVAQMYEIFNMGIGFCVIVKEQFVDKAIQIIVEAGHKCTEIGLVIKDAAKLVVVSEKNLFGFNKHFKEV